MKQIKIIKLLLVFSITAVIVSPQQAKADPVNWLSNQNYNLTQLSVTPNSVPIPEKCTEGKMMVRKDQKVGSTNYPEISINACMEELPYGRQSGGYLEMSGTTIGGKQETSAAGQYNSYFGVPNSPHVLSLLGGYGSSNGTYLGIFKDVMTKIVPTQNQFDKKWTYKINSSLDATLTDKAGNRLPVNSTYKSYSKNGRWMVTNSPYKGVIRIDLETFDVVPISNAYCVGCGYQTTFNSAISDDGRWVVIADEASFKIVDVSTCAPVPDVITGPVACQKKELNNDPMFAGIGPSRSPPFKAEFVTNNVIRAYMTYGTGATKARGTYLISTQGEPLQTLDYLALGDSYASGEGAYNYEPETDTSENDCHLSKDSYPYLISDQLNMESFKSIACSGARIQDVLKYSQKTQVPNPNSLGEWLPGKNPQLSHVERVSTDVITVSISGNDIGFEGKIKKCANLISPPSTCYNSYKERREIVNEINAQHGLMVAALKKIKTSTSEGARVYVTGYPLIASGSGGCAVNVKFNATEVELANKIVNHLNYAIEQAAIKVGVKYVDVSQALAGKRLCETGKEKIALNGFTAGDQIGPGFLKVIGRESYHPNLRGQKMLKDKVLQQTNSFQDYTLPATSTYVAPTVSSSTAQALVDGFTPTNETIRSPQYNNQMTNQVIKLNDPMTLQVPGIKHGLKPNTPYVLELHSTPINLGTYTTDGNGDLTISTTLPGTADPGVHTLHILGENRVDEPIDIYQDILVTHSDDDYDGDGILNDQEKCLGTEVANIDSDQDGADDACDGFIDYSPDQINGLYRIRNGSVANNEPVNRIYIERNAQKSLEMFGINDYDPDNDGWSLVAVSDNVTDGTIASHKVIDTGLAVNDLERFKPTVSIRTADKGCVRLRAQSLEVVEASQMTGLEIEAEDTDTCRSQSPEEDADNNAVPDNLQQLYRSRHGDSLRGEDSDKIYIERNVVAAEAVLGQSDYDPDNDGWSLVGASDAISGADLNTLVLVDSEEEVKSDSGSFTVSMLSMSLSERRLIRPVILYKNSLNECKSLVPQSLDTVKIGQSRNAINNNSFSSLCT